MGLAGVIQEVAHDRVRDEWRNDQSLVLPRAKGCGNLPVQPRDPEAAFFFVEALRPGEAHTTQFVCDLLYPLAARAGKRLAGETWQRRHEISERMIGRDGVRPIRELAVEGNDSVPAAVKSQIPAQTEDAILNRAVLRNEAQRPHLRVKYAVGVRRLYVVDAWFKERD